ncbi:DUF3379 family protein [Undibacterium arcticum]|uniref:DUF3379 family protein n=1 Tax=Undibacterium arcticum TaxID=1762892 RepID=A0ABV7EXC4_9BURK
MNCLEFRREKLADPRWLSAEALAHLEHCAPCHAFAHSVDESEARLAEMLRVPVPDGLAERVILRRKNGFSFTPRRRALVATILLTVGTGALYWKALPAPDYARLAIEHVIDEPESFTTTRNADPALLRKVLHDFGGELTAPLGQLRYLRLCTVPGGMAWHIVFETDHGLATLLLILARDMKASGSAAEMAGWHAIAQPVGKGCYAIVTDSPESLDAVSRMVRQRIVWRA